MQRGKLGGDALLTEGFTERQSANPTLSDAPAAAPAHRFGSAVLTLMAALLVVACGGGGGAADTAADATRSPSQLLSASAAVAVQPTPTLTPTPTPPGVSGKTAGDTDATVVSFSFDLLQERITSAAVYGVDGSLLRTLWRGERLQAGRHSRRWDQRLDDGSVAPGGPFTVRLIHHNVRYQWDGVVGNTSAFTGSMPHRSFLPPQSLAADGLQLHLGMGYNEAQTAVQGLLVTDPQRPASKVKHTDPFIGFGLVASDGTRLFAANTGGLDKSGFIVAFSTADGTQTAFDEGLPLCLNRMAAGNCFHHQSYRSVIAHRPAGEALATGLAVQRNGRLLAVAYGPENRVRVFDKHSGRLLSEWSLPLSAHSSNHLALTGSGDLWVVSSSAVLRYTAIDSTPRLLATLQGFSKPLAVAADPADDAAVWVADGGSSQQLHHIGRSGVADAVIGQRGGLAQQATLAPDRLCFKVDAEREHTALVVDSAGHVWVVDTCNNRLLRFTAAGASSAHVAWLPASYISAVDSQRPQRVFANFLEFEVDYSRALGAAGAWRLLRNWLPSLPAALRDGESTNRGFGGFRVVTTLANGRTDAQLLVAGQGVIVELTAAGLTHEVMRLPAPAATQSPVVLQANGDLHHGADEGARQVVYRRRLEGFDSSGAPRWAAQAAVLASVALQSPAPYHRMGTFAGASGPRWPVNDAGQLIWFNPAVDNSEGLHLGAVAQGGTQWSWQASPSGALDGRGSFQTRSADATIHYGGNVVMVLGRSVLYGYHGEFYSDLVTGRVGQANQFMHFLDNGLFVGQLGVPSTRGIDTPEPGKSGNAFSPSLVRVAGRTYLYHNDESTWGGVHRWELQGLDDIVEISAAASTGDSVSLR